jgi:hypothetical protein
VTRILALTGAFNVRDLGGLPTEDGGITRPGRLFRSDSLQSVDDRDVAMLYDTLGIRRMVDLRGADEVLAEGRGLLAERAVEYVNLPLVQEDGSLVAHLDGLVDLVPRYLSYLDSPAGPMPRAIELLGDAVTAPTVFFCAAGKDRTGVLSALVLRLARVTVESVIEDYFLSAPNCARILRERLEPSPTYAPHVAVNPPEVYTADAATMRRFLHAIDERHGGVREWVLARGASPAAVDRLAAALTG